MVTWIDDTRTNLEGGQSLPKRAAVAATAALRRRMRLRDRIWFFPPRRLGRSTGVIEGFGRRHQRGSSVLACADQRIGMRTELNPDLLVTARSCDAADRASHPSDAEKIARRRHLHLVLSRKVQLFQQQSVMPLPTRG
jgi:hypothetical protein